LTTKWNESKPLYVFSGDRWYVLGLWLWVLWWSQKFLNCNAFEVKDVSNCFIFMLDLACECLVNGFPIIQTCPKWTFIICPSKLNYKWLALLIVSQWEKELVMLHKILGNPFLTRLVFHILVPHTKVTICLTPLLTKVLIFHWSCFYAHFMHRVLRTRSSWYCMLVPCLLVGLWHNPLRWRSQFVFVDAMKIWGWHDPYISCTFGEALFIILFYMPWWTKWTPWISCWAIPHERMTKYIYNI
jgi:hypothetical protein